MKTHNYLISNKLFASLSFLLLFASVFTPVQAQSKQDNNFSGQRISINENWRFFKYNNAAEADKLIYDIRPVVTSNNDSRPADSKPTEGEAVKSTNSVLKPWILPTGNDFIKDKTKWYIRPAGNPGFDFPFVKNNFDDRSWEQVNLPHDWAVKGPFMGGDNPEVGGGMGRLPTPGVAWYRKKLDIPKSDAGKNIFLDVDGAMSYAMVWLNGKLVGGWPYGYSSWRVDLTPYAVPGGENQIAIRLDNPNYSMRWYTGGGIYRNVWLVKTNPVHISQWGTFVTTKDVSRSSAVINIEISIDNTSNQNADVTAVTDIYEMNKSGKATGKKIASFEPVKISVGANEKSKIQSKVAVKNPKLWGPAPTQVPNMYAAVTTLLQNGKPVDKYETHFGIRNIKWDSNNGLYVNGELIKIKGVCQHHDLGALGAAFNTRAAERQLEILKEIGCNAIRNAHNVPAAEVLDLCDRMGILVMDEAFDMWYRMKNPLDFHLIFPDWYEQDTRSMVRRDRNHPSVIIWSMGNEVGEQYTGEAGAAFAKKMIGIIKDEDPTRLVTTGLNYAQSTMPLPAVLDIIGLNYQGEGIRQFPEFEGTERIRITPQYDVHHKKFPDKVIIGAETASAASSRGVYLFPVTDKVSDIIRDGRGGDSKIHQVSSYELYQVDFGSSADKVFAALDSHPFVAGEFVWTGFDYIGEPTPYYEARSSYNGIIDLAGFKKDRYYLYQAHWRPELPMAHILPHWNWPDRVGKITPVHVFTSGDEAELFLNGKSLGRKIKGKYEYRLRWDEVKYEPGELKVITYKNGKEWARDVVKTTDKPFSIELKADRNIIKADGKDLSFITLRITDKNGLTVPIANNNIKFEIKGSGEIAATDNGDATNFVSFASPEREAFNGLALAIVRSKKDASGSITLTAKSPGLKDARIVIKSEK